VFLLKRAIMAKTIKTIKFILPNSVTIRDGCKCLLTEMFKTPSKKSQ